MKTNMTLDAAGIGLSTLCVIHCLFLPILGATMPVFGVVSEAEWLHKALVILAVPIALNLIFSTSRLPIQALSLAGISLLCAAAFVPQFHDVELAATLLGAIFCASAHTLHVVTMRHSH